MKPNQIITAEIIFNNKKLFKDINVRIDVIKIYVLDIE